ncbi:hypothetical protein P7D85_02855 [Enterococcus hulanensis]|uniref:Antitoxin n=1 Tax=Enterococcus hulanensis TaxID=2559929 RepID=A0ABU3EV08_9ENTE|nr:hypothetical protein [Enterococcus hulanensis]MDT2598695.1 hypothetical protein [Enterococcus hulanensis]MDT2607801.1 hypothetical protein [Enterococcus hulanensis]MDT2615096.1 hypothetical protein [Enterococcus hulanensis]MDT2626934.1 hypothetical protein [Enterococcus hulanensis]MDT2654167.1 hypothetical protein [Enterococcus hulanensis]
MNKAEAISNAVMSTKVREGMELAKIEVAHSMLKDELPLETISKYSKLSIEKLEELKKENE